ncbi:protein mono-ADP-ribosyltransferase PARP9 [Garra rufa]|uniref:protein mono-ADP-ribosyltransferase PARP9 n=1 Tax=Garra rufa TaxID=137080 RepID=UPI003CCEDD1F
MSDKEQSLIPLFPEHAAILGKCASTFSHAVKEKFNCTAILHNVEESGSFASNTSGVWRAEKRYSIKLSRTVEISVWKDDLTRHEVEAVVNAANEKLKHGGGLAQALCDAGGPAIQKWSDDIIHKQKKVATGTAVLTSAGNLPCKYIIHAVGPKVSQNPSQKEVNDAVPFLHNTVFSILNLAVDQNITSVAIPALSSGLFNFPRDRCADVIVYAIMQFHGNRGFQGKNLEIHLVNNDEPSVREMERAARAFFNPTSTSASYSGAVKGQNQTMTTSSSNSLRFENLMLYLKKGSIEEEKVDVIVNTIAADCDLSQGLISQAILAKAGRNIQDEIIKKKKNHGFSRAYFYETGGYHLNCSAVFHTVCAYRTDPKASQILHKVIVECLRKASASKHKSISFPAIGTGNLGFEKKEVANIMTNAVAEFANQHTKTKLDVYFVVFPTDSKTMEAFENEMKGRKRETKSPEVHHDVTSFASASQKNTASEKPTLEIQSVSNEALREAKSWIFKILDASDQMTIKNNHVMYLDQRDHEILLSLQTMLDVRIKEFFRNGKGGITITGNPLNISCAAIEVESMLCKAQENFAQAEEGLLSDIEPFNNSFYARTPVIREEYSENVGKALEDFRSRIIKMEKLENTVLKQLFNKNRQRVKDPPKRLYQRVSAQFCDLICRVGFQKEFAPPAEQKCGSGIYFSSTVDGAIKLWDEQEHEQYIYIIQAQVLTGKSTKGSRDLILPPPLDKDPLERYNSVYDSKETYVIFSGQQALPEYLFICAKQ